MVRAVDIEGLIKRYLDENSFERADALYLLVSIGREDAAKTLTLRYGVSGALSSVLEDLKILGVGDTSVKMEDTNESLKSAVERSFESLCLNKLVENAVQKAQSLSQTARKILYIISVLPHEMWDWSVDDLTRFYLLVFREKLDRDIAEEAIKELIRCYVIQRFSGYSVIERSPYLGRLLSALKDFIPIIEVKVSWPEKEM